MSAERDALAALVAAWDSEAYNREWGQRMTAAIAAARAALAAPAQGEPRAPEVGRVPNNDEVICPGCTHQFRAVPVNVQEDIAALRADNEQQAREIESLRAECGLRQIRGYNEGKAERDALRECVKAADGQLSRVLHEMAGSVSLCWEPKPIGIFHSTKACEFVAAAISELRAILRDYAARAKVQL